jgi:hypothetical protein
VAVEVDDADGTVGAVDGAEEGKGYRVVAAQGDDSGEGLAILGRAFLLGVCLGLAGEDAVVAFFDLVEGVGVVVSGVMLVTLVGFGTVSSVPYEVTGMSPQSSTVAQLLKGFVSRGTL